MGYEVHITRAEFWAENAGQEISADEWWALVQSDAELVPVPANGKYFVIWRGSVEYPETWFDWFEGNITTKNPDKATLRKMLQMAERLNARVQGDDGELYTAANTQASAGDKFKAFFKRGKKSS